MNVPGGIHFGEAVVGNVWSREWMDYTAARLEASAPGGTVYISRAAADALGDRAVTASLGDLVPLKGNQAGLEVLIPEDLSPP